MKSGSLVRVVWAMGFMLPVAVGAVPGQARACGSAISLSRVRLIDDKPRVADDKPALVAAAEQSLSEGKYARAAVGTVNVFPALKLIQPGTTPLADRALRILALAAARTDGGITVGGLSGATFAERTANLEWSIDILRKLNAKRANNPSYRTDLGEALSKVPAHHDEALRVLGELSDKDLLTTAEGYAALARLRAEKGDAAAREAAVKRCAAMTKRPQICDVPAAAAADANSRT
jgi:hypothetical protein